MRKIDLQLFAEEEAVDETVEESTEEVVDETEDDDETVEEVEEEEEADDEPKPEPKKKSRPKDSVPLSKYMEEKRKRQEYERLLASQEDQKKLLDKKQELVNRGWPESEAEMLARQEVERDRDRLEMKSRTAEYDIRDLARSDDFFSDAEAFKDEIKEKMLSLNIDARDAYMLVRGPARMQEVQLEREQRDVAERRTNKQTKKIENASAAPVKSPYKLDADDKKALAELQKAQPNAGWTPEKYAKLMKE